jgi:hypothetical protein
MRRIGERVGCSTKHLGPAVQRRSQVALAGVAFTHFQKACSEIGARQGVIGTQRQRMPVGVGGRGILAVQQQDASERRQDFRVPWRSFASVQKNSARFATLIAVEVQSRKVHLQIDVFGHQRKSAFDDGDGFVDASSLHQVTSEFLECRRKWRAPRRGSAQLFNRFRVASGAAKRRAKQGFDTRIVAAACCLFEQRDRLPSTVLSDEGSSQDLHGDGVGPARSQDFSGELLGHCELAPPQREGGPFELSTGMMVSAAGRGQRRMLWHGLQQ